MTEPAGLDAAIRQGTQNAERIAGLNAALNGLSRKLGELGTAVDGIQGTVADQAEGVLLPAGGQGPGEVAESRQVHVAHP